MTNAIRKWVAVAVAADRPDEVREVAVALYAITRLVVDEYAEARMGRVTCVACGCLCLPGEVCPGCRARTVMAARKAAQVAWDESA